MNDSRVLPARLYGEKEGTGSFIEFLLLEQKGDKLWEILVRPGKKAKPGTRFSFGNGRLKAEILETVEGGNRIAKFECEGNFFTALEDIGQMPLPPYITKSWRIRSAIRQYIPTSLALPQLPPQDCTLQMKCLTTCVPGE